MDLTARQRALLGTVTALGCALYYADGAALAAEAILRLRTFTAEEVEAFTRVVQDEITLGLDDVGPAPGGQP